MHAMQHNTTNMENFETAVINEVKFIAAAISVILYKRNHKFKLRL